MLDKSPGVNTALAHFCIKFPWPESHASPRPQPLQTPLLLWILHKEPGVPCRDSASFHIGTTLAPLAFLFPEQLFAKRMTQSSGPLAKSGGSPFGPSQLTLSKASLGTRAGQQL